MAKTGRLTMTRLFILVVVTLALSALIDAVEFEFQEPGAFMAVSHAVKKAAKAPPAPKKKPKAKKKPKKKAPPKPKTPPKPKAPPPKPKSPPPKPKSPPPKPKSPPPKPKSPPPKPKSPPPKPKSPPPVEKKNPPPPPPKPVSPPPVEKKSPPPPPPVPSTAPPQPPPVPSPPPPVFSSPPPPVFSSPPPPPVPSPPPPSAPAPPPDRQPKPWDKARWDKHYMNNWTPVDPAGGLVLTDDQLHVDMMITTRNQIFGHFLTKKRFMFGYWSMYMKLIPGESAGCIMTYYFSSPENHSVRDSNGKSMDTHDEMDFEFLGNVTGQPISLQTNLYLNGRGGREMRHNLPFDPSADFHKYSLLWNENLIIWYVDDKVIRVHYNKPDVPFPLYRPMAALASLWNGSDWATEGGKKKLDITKAPFILQYEGFDGVEGCEACPTNPFTDPSEACTNPNLAPCKTGNYWWEKQTVLTAKQIQELKAHINEYVIYNYCKDDIRFKNGDTGVVTYPPECKHNEYN